MDQPAVAVIGPGGAHVDAALLAAAEAVGAGLARAGITVVTGGLGGVMAAAARGAQTNGGMTVGILPGTDRGAANPHVSVAVPTGLGEGRNVVVVRAADAVVAVGAGYGTLSEIALALKAGVPVFGIETWELAAHGVVDSGITVVATPEEAVRAATAAVRGAGHEHRH